ncbi:MAG: SDR family oxidoreductase [Akkermansiaceae bacterium]|nr:SDR family oxidoreductase [Armatimonadota bacterium]
MPTAVTTPQDPRETEPKPPFPQEPIKAPGTEAEMTPQADHGENSYVGAGRLKERVALITGADSGIGRAVAIAFAREGADVVISYLNEDEDARETARLVEDAGRRALVIGGDITEEAHCQSLVRRAQQELGRLDILVNNAAYQKRHESIQEMTAEELDRTFRTNVFAMFYLCKAALADGVMGPGGSIINTASIQGYDPDAALLAYAPTKAAIVNFSKALAKEAIQKGVRVNVVAPGPVWTPLIPSTLPPERAKTFGQDTAFGRPAQPAELAPIFVLLASPEASYITGEVYGATGGQSPF